jgi:hypothetical protein
MAINFGVPVKLSMVDGFSPGLKAAQRSLADFKKSALATFAGNLMTKAFSAGIKNVINTIPEYTSALDTIGKSAQKIGLSAESFQKLSYAASQANVSQEKFTASFGMLNKNLGSGSLVKFLSENNKALAGTVRNARSNEDTFYALADAISRETDIAKKSALGNAAFGKSWMELVPLLDDGAETIREIANEIPDLASNGSIKAAQMWNDTWTEINRNFNAFKNVIREAFVKYVLPYVLTLKEWLKENRELVKQKIAETIEKIINALKKIIPVVQDVLKFVSDFGPVIIGIVAGIKAVTTVMGILNVVMAANPVVLIITAIIAAVALLVVGFALLTKKVGGIGPALEVVRETIFKALLTPFNTLLDVLEGILWVFDKITGTNLSAGLSALQDKMNIALTGSSSTMLESAVKGAVEGYREGGVLGAVSGGTGSAIGVMTDSYGRHRESYLAEHPEEVEDSKWSKLFEEFKKSTGLLQGISDNTEETAEGVNNLNGGQEGPAKSLNYSLAGIGDIWSIVRQGI